MADGDLYRLLEAGAGVEYHQAMCGWVHHAADGSGWVRETS